MKKHLTIKIYGVVQGVSFRYWAKKTAKSLGIFGYVENRPDGSVFIEAEGDEKALNIFIGLCHDGPSGAKVEKIEFDFSDALQNYPDFESRHAKRLAY